MGRLWLVPVLVLLVLSVLLAQDADAATAGAITPEATAWHVIRATQRGATVASICWWLELCRTTVRKIRRYFKKYGTVPTAAGGSGRRLRLSRREICILKRIVDESPDLYLDELSSRLSVRLRKVVPVPTVHDYLRRTLGYTRKKVGPLCM